MKDLSIILSTDDYFSDFIPIVKLAWEKFFFFLNLKIGWVSDEE